MLIHININKNTPKSITHDALHITNKLDLSFMLNSGDNIMLSVKHKLKHAIDDKLHTMNIPYINCLQLCISSTTNNMEYLDLIMDTINDYYHQGLTQSYSLNNNFSHNDINNIKSLNFDVPMQSNTINNNLLWRNNNNNDYDQFYKYYHDSIPETKIIYNYSLAGNLLSNKYMCNKYDNNKMNIDCTMSLMLQELNHPNNMDTNQQLYHLKQCAKRIGNYNKNNKLDDMLKQYTNILYKYLLPLATKYNVSSISSIALRWLLQFHPNSLGSILIDIDASIPNEHNMLKQHEKELKEVFTFELEENDVVMLNEIAGIDMNKMTDSSSSNEEELMNMMNDRALWL